MNPCENFQAQLLDHLYGLLDDEPAQALASHLEACEPCRTARTALEAKCKLLAAAAKAEFPGVVFRPPQETVHLVEPKTATVVKPVPAVPFWAGWAIAAGVLLTA